MTALYPAGELQHVARAHLRQELRHTGIAFQGHDLWRVYDFSWLNTKGRPETASIAIEVPCHTTNIIESKSLKLYLHGFASVRIGNSKQLTGQLTEDLSKAAGGSVEVTLKSLDALRAGGLDNLPGLCLDELDIEVDTRTADAELLECVPNKKMTGAWLHSHLLRTLCPITGQPDWASICIGYSGAAICHQGLLRYLLSYQGVRCFHELAVECIFQDIARRCQPSRLDLYACFQRRGGIDINPFRSSHRAKYPLPRTARQ